MALELHIAGPGFDVTRRLQPGEPALILGRDTDCGICLPDPERNVSRRHLSVWNEHEHCTSACCPSSTASRCPRASCRPARSGMLRARPGAVPVGDYRLEVQALGDDTCRSRHPSAAFDNADPWADFERQAAELAGGTGPETVPFQPEDDPFGDWGFHSTFGPGSPGGALRADAAGAGHRPDALLRRPRPGARRTWAPLSQGELEAIGRAARASHCRRCCRSTQSAALSRQDVHADDRTMVEPRKDNNPLRWTRRSRPSFTTCSAAAPPAPASSARAGRGQVATELAAHSRP